MTSPAAAPRLAPGSAAETAVRTLLWWALAAWLGSWLCFAGVIAPTVFRVLPSPELAGRVVGPVLATLHWGGALCGLLLTVLAGLLGRGPLLLWLPLGLGAACLGSELGVTPQLAALRDAAFGAEAEVEAVVRYRQLHGLSMAIFSVVLGGVMLLVPLHVRRESPQAADSA